MIHSETLTMQWLNARAKDFKLQPDLLERMVHAFVLVEELSLTGLEFTFRGGTSLALHFNDLQRLSIDVDIEVERAQGFTALLQALNQVINQSSAFIDCEEVVRPTSTQNSRHVKVRYASIREKSAATSHVLLDVVLVPDSNPFRIPVNLTHKVLSVVEPNTLIHVPSVEALLGEKLTAIATLTTGVPMLKELDMVKQVFDVHRLMQIADLSPVVLHAFKRTLGVQRDCFGQNYTEDEVIADIGRLALSHYHSNDSLYHPKLKSTTSSGVRSLKAYLVKNVTFNEERFRLTLLDAALLLTCASTGRMYTPINTAEHAWQPSLPNEYLMIESLPKTEKNHAAWRVHQILSHE